MRTKITLLLLLIALSSSAQKINFSFSTDVKNITKGSKATNYTSQLNYISKIELQSKKASVSFGVENFKSIRFERYFIGVGSIFNIKKVNVVYSIETSVIGRYGKDWGTKSSHLALGGNLDVSYSITKNIMLGISSNILRRTDLKSRYPEVHTRTPTVVSNFLKLSYSVNLK